MQNTLMGLPVEFWAIICFAVAAAYGVFWPRPPRTADKPRSAWQHLVLRWFHSLTWAFLGLAALLLKFTGAQVAQIVGLMALAAYLIFMTVFIREKLRYPQG